MITGFSLHLIRSIGIIALGSALIFCGDRLQASSEPVTFPPSECVGPVPANPGTGLTAYWWKQNAADNGAADWIIAHRLPQARFLSTGVNYPISGDDPPIEPLADFLAGGAKNIVGDISGQTDDFDLFRFVGFIAITADMDTEPTVPGIQVYFGLESDDGARLKIGSQTIISRDGAKIYREENNMASFEKPGLYPIEVLFYDDFGVASGVKLRIGVHHRTTGDVIWPDSDDILPTSVLYPSVDAPVRVSRTIRPAPLVVGWHDEFNTLRGWTNGSPAWARVAHPKYGDLDLGIRQVPSTASVARDATVEVSRDTIVNLDQFPVMVADVVGATPASTWRLGVQSADGDGARQQSSEMRGPGLATFDVADALHLGGVQHLRLTLSASGPAGTHVDFGCVRFILFQDTPYVQKNPHLQDVRVARRPVP